MSTNREFKPLVAVGCLYIQESAPYLRENVYNTLVATLEQYIEHKVDFDTACKVFERYIASRMPIDRIRSILNVPANPLPPTAETFFSSPAGDGRGTQIARKRARPWTEAEDQRLLSAINRFGLDNWSEVTNFVGSGRSRAQCSQRWYRGLDPRISKVLWTPEEENRLLRLVSIYGDKSWTKVASEMGNRSDAQCRYHYRQMMRDTAYENQRRIYKEIQNRKVYYKDACIKAKLPSITEFCTEPGVEISG